MWEWIPAPENVEWKCKEYASSSDECVYECDSDYDCDVNGGCTICGCDGGNQFGIYTMPNYLQCNDSQPVNGNKNVFS